jgi:hypothetical protein
MSKDPDQDWIDGQVFDDDEDDQENDGWDECGRWNNGRLSAQCSKAGSEECDWHCPIGLPRRNSPKRKAAPLLDRMKDHP